MFAIKNNRDLRLAHRYLILLKKYLKRDANQIKEIELKKDIELEFELFLLKKILPVSVQNLERDVLENRIKEVKSEIRKYGRKRNSQRIIKNNFDGGISLIELPDFLETISDADSYFKENIEISISNSPYDCTGKLFTNWYKIFKRNGKFYAYHCVSLDV